MTILTPKSHRVRHKILVFLTIARTKQQINNLTLSEAGFTLESLSKEIGESISSVDMQLNFLYSKKLVVLQPVIEVPDKRPISVYMASPDGMSKAASMDVLHDGIMFRTSVFNNIASGAFQIFAGIAALLTIMFNFTSIVSVNDKINKLEQSLERIEERQKVSSKGGPVQKSASDTMANHQTKPRNADIQ